MDGVTRELERLYAMVVAQYGDDSPVARKLVDMIKLARRNARRSQRLLARKITRLRVDAATVWRLLTEIRLDGGPRVDPPLPVYESQPVLRGVVPYTLVTGLDPPLETTIIQRK